MKLPFPRRTTAVAVEDGAMRSVTLRGRRVIAWETTLPGAPLTHRSGKASTIADAPLDAVLLRYAEIRAVPQRHIREVLLAEIQDRLPFSLDRMDVAWAWRPGGTGVEAAAAAIAADALDRRMRQLKDAGITPGHVYPRATALAALAPSGATLVIHFAADRAEIVRAQDGVPLLTHSLRIPDPAPESPELISLLSRAAERIAGALDDTATTPPSPLAIVLTGALATQEYAEALAGALGVSVTLAAPALTWPDGFPVQSYAAALGLAIAAQRDPRKTLRASAVPWEPLDMLPPRYRPQPRWLLPAVAVGIAAVVGMGGYSLHGAATRAESRVAALQAGVASLELAQRSRSLERAQITALEQRASLTGLRIQELEALPVQQGQRMAVLLQRMESIAEAADTLGIRLSQKNFDEALISIAGAAPDFARVSAYAAVLRDSTLFSQVRIVAAELHDAGGSQGQAELVAESVNFQIQASVV